jgi:hypothetical protein
LRLIPEKLHRGDDSQELGELLAFVGVTHRAGIRPELPATVTLMQSFANDRFLDRRLALADPFLSLVVAKSQ